MSGNDSNEMNPAPTFNIPVACLILGVLFVGLEVYAMLDGRVQVAGLFIAPGAILLGVIGIFDPLIPSSLQPGATGYPPYAKRIANACWVVSVVVGAMLYWLLVK